jgi:hypothetical protein
MPRCYVDIIDSYFKKNGGYDTGTVFSSGTMEETPVVWLVSHVSQNAPERGATVLKNLGVEFHKGLNLRHGSSQYERCIMHLF